MDCDAHRDLWPFCALHVDDRDQGSRSRWKDEEQSFVQCWSFAYFRFLLADGSIDALPNESDTRASTVLIFPRVPKPLNNYSTESEMISNRSQLENVSSEIDGELDSG